MFIFEEHLGKTEVDILVLEILRVPIEIGLRFVFMVSSHVQPIQNILKFAQQVSFRGRK